jgi:hypothetical protein
MTKLKSSIADEPEWPHAYKIIEINGKDWLYGEMSMGDGDFITFYGKDFDDLVREFIKAYNDYEEFEKMDFPSE